MNKSLCESCPDRRKCRQLCPKAEEYVNQDDNEDAWRDITPVEYMDEYSQAMPDGLSTCEAMLQNYFIDRMDVADIAQRYDKSRQYTYRIIHKYKLILIKNIKKSVESSSLIKA